MTHEPQENRLLVLARFIRNQCGLVTQKGGKVVQGVGDVHLNHEEALLAAEALERACRRPQGMTPEQLEQIRANDKRDFASTKQYVADSAPITCRADRRALLSAYDELLARVKKLEDERIGLEAAAECWDAICTCYRITCMGSAGLMEFKNDHGYAHATFNLWTRRGLGPDGATGDAQDLRGRELLSEFIKIALANFRAAKVREGEKEAS